ncbi:MAG TPA: hypothetical protein VGS22_25160 [Thermoanaerobaculia bacterium]|jgi:hypothetical protein|nr:hypothetical protein [Thermoanaerobaculia bacterium]
MNALGFLQLLPGPFNFLRIDADELRRLVPDYERTLPIPRPVFLEDERATPVLGFAVAASERMELLRSALRQFLAAEEAVQISVLSREPLDRKIHTQAWDRYRSLLSRALENAIISSFGRQFASAFWLYHSLDIARFLKETPRRVLRQDSELGRRYGDQIRYRVLDRYLDRVLATSYELVQKVAAATEEVEEELFPRLLTRMRDNVLIFTEDHISHDFTELSVYFSACLRLDGREFRQRHEELVRWHDEQLTADKELAATASYLLGLGGGGGSDGGGERGAARDLLIRPGYVSFLATRKAWNPNRLLTPDGVKVWENLLEKLKEFELLHALRRSFVTVERTGGRLIAKEPGPARALVAGIAGGTTGVIALSHATRPLDFLEPWVVDPRVERFGLTYDISDFSQTISLLQRSGEGSQDEAFRMMFRYQRRVNRFAQSRRVKLEKYLGDGAFYSSREATRPLLTAIHIQRAYAHALTEGFPFDQGLRIALNHGAYRLIPMGDSGPQGAERYEFFGHGLVELSRLVTGKTTREVEDIKNLLLRFGYPAQAVERFFEPLQRRDVEVIDKSEEARPFYVYLDRNGSLINQGIVATQAFLAKLSRERGTREIHRANDGERIYCVVGFDDGGERIPIGFRPLGAAQLKGLDELPLYEIIDAAPLSSADWLPLPAGDLLATLDRELRRPGRSR